jgi:hypothetical protein
LNINLIIIHEVHRVKNSKLQIVKEIVLFILIFIK